MTLEAIAREVRNCKKDPLWKTRSNTVPGEGPEAAEIMFVGQNPGKDEDLSGRPFVGRSGKYMENIMEQNNIFRDDVFITSVVKCRTPLNRKPNKQEIDNCMPYLLRQIDCIKPVLIVLMGEVAWSVPRSDSYTYLSTYHPSAAMRFPSFRIRFEDDFSLIHTFLE